jgi:hypothetical protein
MFVQGGAGVTADGSGGPLDHAEHAVKLTVIATITCLVCDAWR